MLHVGIDPGKTGGIGWICTVSGEYGAVAMPPTTRGLVTLIDDLITHYGTINATVEEPQLMGYRVSGKVLLSFGKHYGEIVGILTAAKAQINEVRPATWKRGLNLTKDKNDSILLCERLYPNVELFPGRCTKGKDGIAEAILLAHYGKKMGGA